MLKRTVYMVLVTVITAGMTFNSALAESKNREQNTPVYYLSLGTSLAAGVQADPETGDSVVTEVSYPSKLADLIGQDIHKLRHVNLGCPGETAESLIFGGKCEYSHGSQLDEAVQFLHAHGKFTSLITIDLGANDVLQCLSGTVVDPTCLSEKLAQLQMDLMYVLETLREVAPNVPIVAMNYYNPLLVYWTPEDETIAVQTILLQQQLNGLLEGIYTAYEIPFADVASAFMSYDITTDANSNFIPDSVELLCAWTWMCSESNIHPNEAGYEAIAWEFYTVLPELSVLVPPRKRINY